MPANPPAPKHGKPPGLWRAIGQFFGHIAQGVKSGERPGSSDAGGGPDQSVVIRHDVQEQARETQRGVVRVRRTVIEEVSLAPEPPRADEAPKSQSPSAPTEEV